MILNSRFIWKTGAFEYRGQRHHVYQCTPGLYFEKITANAQAGYIELAEIEAGELDVKTNTGQIIASAFSAEQLDAECGVGQIILEGEVTELAEINCNVGEVRCTLPGTADAYDYELKCAAGGLLIDGESYSSIVDKRK